MAHFPRRFGTNAIAVSPLGLIIRVQDADQMLEVALALQGQLTCTLHLDEADTEIGKCMMPVLKRKAGCVLANAFPTGVEFAYCMVNGGPYPASTNFGATSVSTLSIRRFLWAICYQNVPKPLMPEAYDFVAETGLVAS